MKEISKPKISIIIATFNDDKYIKQCVKSILNQSYTNFELIVIVDGSTDNTINILKEFKNKKIHIINLNNNIGIPNARNIGIQKAKGKYIFITDSDCHVPTNWLINGLNGFYSNRSKFIEGRIIYNYDNYHSTLSDLQVESLKGGFYMSACMAYDAEILKKYKFNEMYKSLQDRELALRILKKYKIPLVKEFFVYHNKKTRTVQSYLKECKRYQYKVMLIKHNKNEINKLRILEPKWLLVALFPPLILSEFIYGRIKSWQDLKLLPIVYIKSIYMRYIIWKTAIKEGVFVL